MTASTERIHAASSAAENLHPADRLAEVRSEIKILQAEEARLREAILGYAPLEREGRRWRAWVQQTISRRLDADAIRSSMSPEWVRDHERESEVTFVRLAKVRGEQSDEPRVHRAEYREAPAGVRRRCSDCGVNWADPPASTCPGCQAYREHQS